MNVNQQKIIWNMKSTLAKDIVSGAVKTFTIWGKPPMFKTRSDEELGIRVYILCATGLPFVFKIDGAYETFASETLAMLGGEECNGCILGEFTYKVSGITPVEKKGHDGRKLRGISVKIDDLVVYESPVKLAKPVRHWKYVKRIEPYVTGRGLSDANEDVFVETKQERIWRICRKKRKVESCESCIRYNEHCTKGHGKVK